MRKGKEKINADNIIKYYGICDYNKDNIYLLFQGNRYLCGRYVQND